MTFAAQRYRDERGSTWGGRMTISQWRRRLYRTASELGDVQAVASGSPAKMARRVVRKQVRRQTGRILRNFGL